MSSASRIPAIFADLRAHNRKALMPFICGSHPAPGDTARLLPALARAGASIVEIGFPFSDPIADGPVIAAAMHEALQRGATPAGVLGELRAFREGPRAEGRGPSESQSQSNAPHSSASPASAHGPRPSALGLVSMISVSLVHRLGPAKFIADAKAAGLDGFIFPDVPVEESTELIARSRDAGLTASLLIAPTTPPDRAEKIAKACTGFIYLLARTGITGEGGAPSPDIAPRVRMLRSVTDLPIACGFGISTAQHVRQVVHEGGADAAIVGSALVRRISEAAGATKDPIIAAESFTKDLSTGLVKPS